MPMPTASRQCDATVGFLRRPSSTEWSSFDRRPNMRVQRTRSSASPPHSPLTRKSLGRFTRSLLGLLLVTVPTGCAWQSSSDGKPLNLNGAGVESLSGNWTGTFEARRAGDCSVQKGDSTTGTFHWTLTVQPDGAFELRLHEARSEERGILGVLGPGYQATALRSFRGDCPGGTEEVRTKLVGQVMQGPAGPILELAGKETACQKANCVFNLRYLLVKDHP